MERLTIWNDYIEEFEINSNTNNSNDSNIDKLTIKKLGEFEQLCEEFKIKDITQLVHILTQREKQNESYRKRYQEHKEEEKARLKQYYYKNKALVNKKRRDKYAENPGPEIEYAKNYYKKKKMGIDNVK